MRCPSPVRSRALIAARTETAALNPAGLIWYATASGAIRTREKIRTGLGVSFASSKGPTGVEFKRGKRAMKLLDHRRFRAAYDFMVLLSEVGLASRETAQFWTDVQTQSAAERAESFGIGAPRQAQQKRRPRRRRRRKPASDK